jgi:hypothetical protein
MVREFIYGSNLTTETGKEQEKLHRQDEFKFTREGLKIKGNIIHDL